MEDTGGRAILPEAARLQRQLNESFEDSPYASDEHGSGSTRKLKDRASFENLGVSIETNHNLLRQLLSERRTHDATEVLVKLRQDIRQMSKGLSAQLP